MYCKSQNHRSAKETMSFIVLAFIFLHLVPSFGLNTDGVLLLSFKYSILGDPLSVLQNWNYDDATPCSWTGVTCTQIDTTTIPGSPDMFRVTSLILPNSQLLGSVTKDLGLIQHLRHLDLSNNFFNGSLPLSIFNATELQVLSVSNNVISGELPDLICQMHSLQLLNLSDNALAGNVPRNLTALKSLTVVSLRSNYFSGSIPSGFASVEVLDLSSNLFNGSLPLDFGGDNLRYLNLSYNKISGSISPEFAKRIPPNVTIDLSFNNLTGAIPGALPLVNQGTESFSGNVELCGKPLKNLCSIPSTLSTPPNVSTTTSPAIAVIPKSIDSVPVTNSSPTAAASAAGAQNRRPGLKPGTIAAIAVADFAGIGLLALVVFYVYQLKKRRALNKSATNTSSSAKPEKKQPVEAVTTVAKTEHATWSCLKMIKGEETSDANTSSDSDQDSNNDNKYEDHVSVVQQQESKRGASGTLVKVDGETELEVETLFKASAYILGTSSSSIVYKAVLADGAALAVRRIGETCSERLKDFESQVKAIAKLKHPNLVKLRGFYWGDEEKLLIHDYVSNGCLASFSFRKPSSSPLHLPLEVRLKIARGVARGLAYIHEKKHVHGNIKPSNILLNSEMEPIISDFGLDRLVSSNVPFNNNNTSYKESNSSSRLFGSQKSTTHQDQHVTTSSSPYAAAGSSGGSMSLYQAPELLKTLKPNPKWDVYSFGIVLLELLTGRVLSERELDQYSAVSSASEEKIRVLRMADVTIRGDMESREDAMLACFKLGFSCASFVPQKRPSMKEAAQILERIIPC